MGVTAYVFVEKSRKLFLNYPQKPILSIALICIMCLYENDIFRNVDTMICLWSVRKLPTEVLKENWLRSMHGNWKKETGEEHCISMGRHLHVCLFCLSLQNCRS